MAKIIITNRQQCGNFEHTNEAIVSSGTYRATDEKSIRAIDGGIVKRNDEVIGYFNVRYEGGFPRVSTSNVKASDLADVFAEINAAIAALEENI